MDGILNVNKPRGVTSFSVVSLVKRLSRERRVGHAGTLDPAAAGVLPICLGQGTRVVQFLMEAGKTYRAQIELGVTTDTYDMEGRVIRREDATAVSQQQLELALASFRGSIQQVPPMYSAVKHQGQPLYKLARAGVAVKRKSRLANIYRLELIAWELPIVTIEVECGKGTYIRTLAHDLGQSLGCGASLKELTRLKYGVFDIADAIPLPELEDAFRRNCWQRLVYPVDTVLLHLPAVAVGDDVSWEIQNGRPVTLQDAGGGGGGGCSGELSAESRCRAYASDGHFLAVLRFDPAGGQWHPEKVFPGRRRHEEDGTSGI